MGKKKSSREKVGIGIGLHSGPSLSSSQKRKPRKAGNEIVGYSQNHCIKGGVARSKGRRDL